MEIFIGQVITACKPDLAVYDGDLAVVAVIEEKIEAGSKGIEDTALEAEGLHLLYEIRVDKADAAHIIIEDAHFHAGLCALDENLLDLVPALCVLDRMVFHENKAFCFCQFLQLGIQSLQSIVVIGDLSIFIDRITGIFLR